MLRGVSYRFSPAARGVALWIAFMLLAGCRSESDPAAPKPKIPREVLIQLIEAEDTRAARRGRAAHHHDHVRAQARDLRLDRSAGALADGQGGDHRAHADDDAEHGERRAQLVALERAPGQAERHEQVHGYVSVAAEYSSTGIAASSWAASRGLGTRTSSTRWPSRKPMMREAYSAMSGS